MSASTHVARANRGELKVVDSLRVSACVRRL